MGLRKQVYVQAGARMQAQMPYILACVQGIVRHLRQCRFCTSSSVGDEFHIIMQCPHSWLTQLRNLCQLELLKQIPQFSYLPIKEKFIYLISCADLTCCKIVAPYMYQCLKFVDDN